MIRPGRRDRRDERIAGLERRLAAHEDMLVAVLERAGLGQPPPHRDRHLRLVSHAPDGAP